MAGRYLIGVQLQLLKDITGAPALHDEFIPYRMLFYCAQNRHFGITDGILNFQRLAGTKPAIRGFKNRCLHSGRHPEFSVVGGE